MKAMKAIKKMVALGMGLTMVGATIMGASAFDLGQYPEALVGDSVQVAFGDTAKAEDIAGAADIAASLARFGGGVLGGAVVLSGEAALIREGGDELEIEENASAVKEIFDDDDLMSLASGTLRNQEGVFTYNQYLQTADASIQHTTDDEDDDSVVKDYLVFQDGADMYEYQLEFTSQAESDVGDGSDDDELEDFEQKSIKILGNSYKIIRAEKVGSGNNSIELDLVSGEVTDIIGEGEGKTFQLPNGETVEVEVLTVADRSDSTQENTPIKLRINGVTTESLTEGETYVVGNVRVSIIEVLANEGSEAEGRDQVEIGVSSAERASKLTIKDTDTSDTASSDELEADDEDVNEVNARVEGSVDSEQARINRIVVAGEADDDWFVPMGGKLSEVVDDVNALFGGIDYSFDGWKPMSGYDEIRLDTSGDDQIKGDFDLRDGRITGLDVFYTPSGTTITLGDGSAGETLHTSEQTNSSTYGISVDDVLLLSSGTTTIFAQYRDYDASEATATFDNLVTNEDIEFAVSSGMGSLISGGKSWTVYFASATDDAGISVDQDDDGDVDGSQVTGVTESEHTFVINGTAVTVTNDGDSEDDFLDAIGSDVLTFTMSATGGEFNDAVVTYNNVGSLVDGEFMTQVSDEDDDQEGRTLFGTLVQLNDDDNGFDAVRVMVPDEQLIGQVYLGIGSFETAGADSDDSSSGRIDVKAARLASEVADVTAGNYVIVGGPCVNTLAAQLLGSDADDCAAGFEAGKALVRSWTHSNGNTAVLVAGFRAADTRMGTTFVANEYDQLFGDELIVSTNSNNEVMAMVPTEDSGSTTTDA